MAGELLLIGIIVNLVAVVLVYQDARYNSPQNAVLWALLVFFAGFLIGGLLYVLLGRDGSTSSQSRHRESATDDDEPMNVDDSGPF